MAIATSAGANYTTQPNINGSGSKNNGGSATRVGTSVKLNNVAVSKDTTGVVGSVVVDGADTDRAVDGGTIAHNHVKPISAKVTTEIAGLASSVLSSSANNPAQLRAINKVESVKSNGVATAIRAGYFNIYTGRFSTNPTPVTVYPTGVPTTNQAWVGTDDAATPTRSAPGELVFRTGAKLPVRDRDYSAKNG
jgi:hypothetical protein